MKTSLKILLVVLLVVVLVGCKDKETDVQNQEQYQHSFVYSNQFMEEDLYSDILQKKIQMSPEQEQQVISYLKQYLGQGQGDLSGVLQEQETGLVKCGAIKDQILVGIAQQNIVKEARVGKGKVKYVELLKKTWSKTDKIQVYLLTSVDVNSIEKDYKHIYTIQLVGGGNVLEEEVIVLVLGKAMENGVELPLLETNSPSVNYLKKAMNRREGIINPPFCTSETFETSSPLIDIIVYKENTQNQNNEIRDEGE